VRVQTFASELAVEGFDEAVVRRLSRPREIQHDTLLVSPDIEIAGDELRSLVDANRLGIADGFADALQGQHDILASIAEAGIDGRREAAESIYNREHADLAAGGELVVNKVHRPGLVDLACLRPILAQLGLHATLRRFVAQLQAQLPVKTVDALDVDGPAISLQQHMDPAIPVSHSRLADVLDPALEGGLVAAL